MLYHFSKKFFWHSLFLRSHIKCYSKQENIQGDIAIHQWLFDIKKHMFDPITFMWQYDQKCIARHLLNLHDLNFDSVVFIFQKILSLEAQRINNTHVLFISTIFGWRCILRQISFTYVLRQSCIHTMEKRTIVKQIKSLLYKRWTRLFMYFRKHLEGYSYSITKWLSQIRWIIDHYIK